MTPPQPEASAKAPWTRTMVGLGPLSWCAATAAADMAGLAEAPVPAKRITPMMADSAVSKTLFSLGLLGELRTFTGTSWGVWPARAGSCARARPGGLADEAADEGQGGVTDLAPAAVDDQGVPAARDRDGLGHPRVAALLFVDGVGDGRRGGVVLLAGDDQHRPAVGVLAVGLGFGEGVEVGGGRLEQRGAGGGDGERCVQLLGFLLADGVGEGVAELVEGQWHGSVVVGGIAQDRRGGPQRGDRQRQHAAHGR